EDQLAGQRGVIGKIFRFEDERHAEVFLPAPQFHEAICLALRRTLGQRQATGSRKDFPVVHRLDPDAGAMALRNVDESGVTQVGPGGHRGKIVIDGLHSRRIPLWMDLRQESNIAAAPGRSGPLEPRSSICPSYPCWRLRPSWLRAASCPSTSACWPLPRPSSSAFRSPA